jgi:hypothetical protein
MLYFPDNTKNNTFLPTQQFIGINNSQQKKISNEECRIKQKQSQGNVSQKSIQNKVHIVTQFHP